MIIPPYLRAADLKPRMWDRPIIPFFVKPDDYRVVDGDTIKLLAAAPRGEKRQEAFRVRFASVDAPEKPWMNGGDRILETIGVQPHPDHPFARITNAVKRMTEGRVLLIEPVQDPKRQENRDTYGRLLAHISVSGAPGPLFVPEGAFNIEHVMLQRGLARPMKDRQVPSLRTETLERLVEFVEAELQEAQTEDPGDRLSF